ncbi:BTAD domain-containing putative transcriptional regulator [Catenulispora yoronensis]
MHISQLRKFLHRPGRPDPIVTRKPGYALTIGSDEFDLHEFKQLAEQGRQEVRAGRFEEAAGRFDDALRLWRGPVLGDLREGPIINGFATWLEETRRECLELQIESGLALGRHRELVGQLYSLTAEHPLSEPFHFQLMLALYRSDRQADALAVYQSARTVLNEQLGLEPGRALRQLQRAILAADHRLDGGQGRGCGARRPRVPRVPRCRTGSTRAGSRTNRTSRTAGPWARGARRRRPIAPCRSPTGLIRGRPTRPLRPAGPTRPTWPTRPTGRAAPETRRSGCREAPRASAAREG